MIDGLHPVRVPSSEEEALRDLVRAREDVRGDLMRARQRLSKLLLRHDVRYEDTASAWTSATARGWRSVDLGERGAQATLLDYLGAIDALVIRRDALEATIAELVPARRGRRRSRGCAACAGSTRSPRSGCAPRSATSHASTRAGQLMSYLGLVPVARQLSGQTRRQGAITKTGSRHARRLLVEAAWHYRRRPRSGHALKRRQDGQPAHVIAISWQAQQRLHRIWRRLDTRARQAPHDRRGRRRPRARRLLLGDSPTPTEPGATHHVG